MGVDMVSLGSKLDEHDRKWAWKFYLRNLAIIVALAGIVCVVPLDFVPLALSLLWNIANIAVLLNRKRAIHPGANVGCDLIIWLTFVAFGSLLTTQAAITISEASHASWSYNRKQYPSSLIDGKRRRGVAEAFGSTFSYLLAMFHFALFVSACRYTQDLRRDEINRRIQRAVEEAIELEHQTPPPQYSKTRKNDGQISVERPSRTNEAKPVATIEESPIPISATRT